MAALGRIGSAVLRNKNVILRTNSLRVAGISTSKKNKDTISVNDVVGKTEKIEDIFTETDKNWVSWGWSIHSREEDNTNMHLTFFAGVTLCIVGLSFYWSYMPDIRLANWSHREAYLQLRHREAEGLALIDPNLISADKFELPSEEDLGDTEIII